MGGYSVEKIGANIKMIRSVLSETICWLFQMVASEQELQSTARKRNNSFDKIEVKTSQSESEFASVL